MSTTTPKFLLPYPEGTDTPDMAHWLKQLADAVEALMNPTWTTISLSAGYGPSPDGPPQVTRVGRLVIWQGGVDGTGITASGLFNPLGTIPVEFRPTIVQRTIAGTADAAAGGEWTFNPDGSSNLRNDANVKSRYNFNAIYMAA